MKLRSLLPNRLYLLLYLSVMLVAGVLAIGWIAADLMSVFVTPHLSRAPLAMLVPFALPVVVLGLGTLVGAIQALVFSLLATLYLAGAVEEAH